MKKRKWLKKGLAFALSAAMVLGMVPGNVGRTVYAAESEAEQSEENWVQVGDFSILTKGVAGTDYEYDATHVCLNILSATSITIKNTDPSTATKHHIAVKAGISADITLAGVNIAINTQRTASAFAIADNSAGNVTLHLVGKNYLTGSAGCAGLQKNGSDGAGALTITGDGELTAIGGMDAAGIGGGDEQSACNIKINSGTITATGGVEGAGIGGGYNGTGSNIIIEGGSVKAMLADWGPEGANAIGGGVGRDAVTPTNGTDPVYLLEIENPNAAEIQVNGKAYTPVSHGDEKKIYAYLPAGEKDAPNMVTVGDTTKAYWYDASAENAKWNTLNVAAVPEADETIYTYDGNDQTYRIAESDLYTVTGNVQNHAGEYTVMVSLKDNENTVWSDGTKEDKTYTFTIERGTLDTSSIEPMREFSCVENISKVSDVSLPYNWRWEEADQSKVLEAGTEVDVTAIYVGPDRDNYTEESCRVMIHIVKTHMDEDGDGRCDVEGCGQYLDGVGAKLAGYSLSLAGNIGVNFYMELSDAVTAEEDAYMNFKLPNGTTSKVYVTGTHADGVTAQKETVTVDGESREYYVFPCEVAAKEMTADIKAQIIVGDMEGTEYTYTVKDYAEYIRDHIDQYGYSTFYLVNCMLNYGGYAQEYFDYRADDLANQGLTEDEKECVKNTVSADTFSSWKATVDNAAEVGTFVSAYLSLKSRTDLCVYVKLADGVDPSEVTFAVDDRTVSPDELVLENVNGSDCYKLTVSDIAAHQLYQMHTFSVALGSGENEKRSTLQYGAFSYAYTALSSDADSVAKQEELCNTLKAMYKYFSAAKIYFDQHNQ